MLTELAVSNLGVIGQVTLRLPTGLIALTGETGAGKTLLVDAINLLMGGRADPGLVKPGADEATVHGRFELDGEEYVLSRVIPADGRSRAYINDRPATASGLADLGEQLVDLHGQHSHQSLLGVSAQRDALDRFGDVDLSRLNAAKARVAELEAALAELGGDERTRARELDLLRYQVRELDAAAIESSDEDQQLEQTEELLANALDHQQASGTALEDLTGENGVRDQLARTLATLETLRPYEGEAKRLRDLLAEIEDCADSIRSVGDSIEPDPQALEVVQTRRHLLHQLCRKYGDDLKEVMAEHASLSDRLAELEEHDVRAARLDGDRADAAAELAAAQSDVLSAREAVCPPLAAATEEWLHELAMPKARVGIDVGGLDGSEVVFKLAANPGSPLQPLAKVASGGELARTMLAVRSVLSQAPPILVFDEVDAGIGGEAGFAVGRALAALGDRHQVLVVTHLPQVAAFADAHVQVRKRQDDLETVSDLVMLDRKDRVTELARMLSGQPDSKTARKHAKELMAEADQQRSPEQAKN